MNIRNQAGISLLEVMISLSMGIVFTTAAMTFLISGQQSADTQDVTGRIQENARFAIDIIRENVRLAGYSETEAMSPAYVFRNPCGTTLNAQDSSVNCSGDTDTDQGDRLAVSFMSPDAEDCLGTDLGEDTHVANVFWVQVDNVTGISSLYCNGFDVEAADPDNGWHTQGGQPLVDGIDQMQVQYGIDSDISDGVDQVDQYLNADEVEAAGVWAQVKSVRVALLVGSGLPALSSSGTDNRGLSVGAATYDEFYDSFTLLDGDEFDPADRAVRRVYTATIAVNNSLGRL